MLKAFLPYTRGSSASMASTIYDLLQLMIMNH